MPAKPKLRLVKPAIQKRAVGPLRRPNSEFRSREHLTETEVEKLIKAAEGNRHGHRDVIAALWSTIGRVVEARKVASAGTV